MSALEYKKIDADIFREVVALKNLRLLWISTNETFCHWKILNQYWFDKSKSIKIWPQSDQRD